MNRYAKPVLNRLEEEVTSYLRDGARLFRTAVLLGLVSLVLCVGTGFASYRSSRQAHIESIAKYNHGLADRLVFEFDNVVTADRLTAADRIVRRWNNYRERIPASTSA